MLRDDQITRDENGSTVEDLLQLAARAQAAAEGRLEARKEVLRDTIARAQQELNELTALTGDEGRILAAELRSRAKKLRMAAKLEALRLLTAALAANK